MSITATSQARFPKAISSLAKSKLFTDLAAYGASEAAAKVSRLFLVIVMARVLDAAAIGLVATALAASEVMKALTQNGVGQRIIAANEDVLPGVTRAAHRIFWVWCGGLFALQAAVAAAFWLGGAADQTAMMILILGLEYLFMPAGLVQCFLAQREGKLKATAAISGAQIGLTNLAAAGLLLLWPSPVAAILPKALSAPVWLIAMRRLRPWRADPAARPAPLSHFTRFGSAILGIELVNALRLQADKFVIGGILGAEALGVWFFAISAGLGLANALSVAFAQVVFPHFCRAEDPAGALKEGLTLAVLILAPAVAAQAALAPWYVPLIYGPDWAGVADLVSLLCLAAIPAVIWTAAAQWLRAEDRAGEEIRRTVAVAAATIAALAVFAPFGLEAAATAYVAGSAISLIAMTLAVAAPVLTFRKGYL